MNFLLFKSKLILFLGCCNKIDFTRKYKNRYICRFTISYDSISNVFKSDLNVIRSRSNAVGIKLLRFLLPSVVVNFISA